MHCLEIFMFHIFQKRVSQTITVQHLPLGPLAISANLVAMVIELLQRKTFSATVALFLDGDGAH
jgi:sorbitol-specific phosphotransferase system component IIC